MTDLTSLCRKVGSLKMKMESQSSSLRRKTASKLAREKIRSLLINLLKKQSTASYQ
jgi:hypothetical protein